MYLFYPHFFYVLGISLPLPADENSEVDDINVDCAICYCYKLENSVPTEVCDHCSNPFHMECLYQYLISLPDSTKTVANDKIFGTCPFCDKETTCHFSKLHD